MFPLKATEHLRVRIEVEALEQGGHWVQGNSSGDRISSAASYSRSKA
jgi:hypothetical protein